MGTSGISIAESNCRMQVGFEVATDRRSGGLNIEAGLKPTSTVLGWHYIRILVNHHGHHRRHHHHYHHRRYRHHHRRELGNRELLPVD